MELKSHIPSGPIDKKWEKHRFEMKLVNPANKRKYHVIVVGTGLAGASAAASLGELGYQVSSFCFQDSPRRAHSIAAQGGINAAKNYQNDGDSVHRLFYDTAWRCSPRRWRWPPGRIAPSPCSLCPTANSPASR
jgi:succinate dehydrogenase / fumarate reductase flavoprotein subunit